MYVVTFYSYKGGVGRTLALMNTAVALARSGKRVLVVDFDLEAPGLCSYPDMSCSPVKGGLVEYVSEYLSTNTAPLASKYIVECGLDGQAVWLMPAGNQADPNYPARLSAINWEDLYELRSGFLMFEDLKQQWREFNGRGFDYVLIDSRTGHTDVGGICTRHLPDAVVVLFLPNEQNISGLVPIVESIRRESTSPRGKSIELHFCPSNVPFLDDEDGILNRILAEAQRRLGYAETASTIHHYNSLELLDQRLFTLHHSKSRLAREYAELKNSICERNIEDRDGVVRALQRASSGGFEGAERIYELPLDEIQNRHGSDPEVAASLAQAFFFVGDFDQQLTTSATAIAAGNDLERMFLLRALTLLRREKEADAVADLRKVLALEGVSGSTVVFVASLLRQVRADDWWRPVADATSAATMTVQEQKRLVQVLLSARESLPAAVSVIEDMLNRKDLPLVERDAHETFMVLALIGMHRYEQALNLIGVTRDAALEDDSANVTFNYAIAEWGRTGKAPKDLFQSLVDRPVQSDDPNYNQCMALAAHLTGKKSQVAKYLDKSRECIRRQGRAFSCWSFLQLDQDAFIQDLEEMEAAIVEGGKSFVLGFMAQGERPN